MPEVPFPLGLEGEENLPHTRRSLQNCWNNLEGQIINRPGITSITTTGFIARGQFVWNGSLYQVVSENLIKITDTATGAFSVIGTITGSEVVETAIGFNTAVIVVKGATGAIYSVGKQDLLTSITSVASAAGIANFNYTGNILTTETTVEITGFTINTAYNVSAIVTNAEALISSTSISSVTDSGGIASFNHAGTSPIVGSEVTISGYIINTDYNTTGIVTVSGATSFEVSTISFGTDEAGGSYTALASFQINSVFFGTDEATGSFATLLVVISGNVNFVPCTDVAHINGRFVYIPFDGDPAFFSDVGAAGSVQATSFFDAEELPDLNNTVFNFRNDLYIGGTDSFQKFRNVTTSEIFGVIQGSRIDNGFIGALIEYNETFLFIGREKDQDFGIYAIGQGLAPKISNHEVDLILSTYSQAQLEAATGTRYKWRGYDIAVFTLPDDTLCFYGGNWHVADTEINGASETWDAGFLTQFEGEYFSAFEGKIGKLSTLNTDYGEAITRIIDIGFQAPDNDFFNCQSVDFGISQGAAADPGTVAIFMSKDNVLYGPGVYKDLGELGEYTSKLEWNDPGGLGTYDGFMGLRIYTRGDVNFKGDYLNANFG